MPLVETTAMDIQILSKIFFIFMSIEKFALIVFNVSSMKYKCLNIW